MSEHPVEPYVIGLLDQVADEFTNAVMYVKDLGGTINNLRQRIKELEDKNWKLEQEIEELMEKEV